MERAGSTQNKTVKIALTGGIGCGKSTVLEILREAGYPVFSCDEIYRKMQTDGAFLSQLEGIFQGVVQDGVLNRKKLADTVFGDAEALKKLNTLTHPLIMQRLHEEMDKYPIAVAEVPLLFESGRQGEFDGVLVVYRPIDERIAAVCRRDNASEAEVLRRIKNQADYEKIIQEGHTVIYNDGNFVNLKEKVLSALEKITR